MLSLELYKSNEEAICPRPTLHHVVSQLTEDFEVALLPPCTDQLTPAISRLLDRYRHPSNGCNLCDQLEHSFRIAEQMIATSGF